MLYRQTHRDGWWPDKMVADTMVRTKIMVWTKWYTTNIVLDKMVWTKWYGQNDTDKMVAIFRIDYSSSEFNTYSVSKNHK